MRALAPQGVDEVVDFAGKVTDVSLELLRGGRSNARRLASIVDSGVRAAGGRYVFVRPSSADLLALGELADAGKLTVPVARVFPLARAGEALAVNKEGHTRGKLVIEV